MLRHSEDAVVRDIAGQLIIVPLVAGMADLHDDLFSFNETGLAVWNGLDGTRTLGALIAQLVERFDAAPTEIEADVMGLVQELLRRGLLVAVDGTEQ